MIQFFRFPTPQAACCLFSHIGLIWCFPFLRLNAVIALVLVLGHSAEIVYNVELHNHLTKYQNGNDKLSIMFLSRWNLALPVRNFWDKYVT